MPRWKGDQIEGVKGARGFLQSLSLQSSDMMVQAERIGRGF